MKKALSVFLMAAMAFGAFADEPVADVKVSEFTGNAAVTWGVNLDSGKTGFKNTSRVDLKLNLLNNGTKSTTGDGVWGELVLKTDGDSFIQWRNDDYEEGTNAFDPDEGMTSALNYKVYVDTAKIHVGPAYVGIKNGNTTVGQLKLDTAVRAEKAWLNDVGANKTQGIVVGFDSDVVKVDVDVRSESYAAQYSNDYGIAAEAELKAVENLSVKGGVSYEFKEKGTLAYAASAGYKLALDDTFYVRPQVGITGVKDADPTLAASVLFGWGEKKDNHAGVYFVNDSADKKVIPGVSVAVLVPVNANQITIAPSFFSGEIVPGLTAAVDANIDRTWDEVLDVKMSTTTTTIDAGVKYALAVDALTITPQVGVEYDNITVKFDDEKDSGNEMNMKIGVDVAGLIDNTTLSTVWTSGELLDGGVVAGTLDFTVKIAL